MLGVKKYQLTQSKRLSEPKKSTDQLQRCSSQLDHSVSKLHNNRYANQNKKLNANESATIIATKLINNDLGYMNKRENKLSQSFHGTLNAHSKSKGILNNIYGDERKPHHHRTIEQKNDLPDHSYRRHNKKDCVVSSKNI
jgi:hypothetical protein